MKKKTRKWLKEAIKRPGATEAYCKKLGYNGITNECLKTMQKPSKFRSGELNK